MTDPQVEVEFLLAVLYTVSIVTMFGGVIFAALTLWPRRKT